MGQIGPKTTVAGLIAPTEGFGLRPWLNFASPNFECAFRFFSGRVSYLEAKEDLEEGDMPGIDEDVPESWTTLEGEFLNVYASKQSWLDYTTQLHPKVRPLTYKTVPVLFFKLLFRCNLLRCASLLIQMSVSQGS